MWQFTIFVLSCVSALPAKQLPIFPASTTGVKAFAQPLYYTGGHPYHFSSSSKVPVPSSRKFQPQYVGVGLPQFYTTPYMGPFRNHGINYVPRTYSVPFGNFAISQESDEFFGYIPSVSVKSAAPSFSFKSSAGTKFGSAVQPKSSFASSYKRRDQTVPTVKRVQTIERPTVRTGSDKVQPARYYVDVSNEFDDDDVIAYRANYQSNFPTTYRSHSTAGSTFAKVFSYDDDSSERFYSTRGHSSFPMTYRAGSGNNFVRVSDDDSVEGFYHTGSHSSFPVTYSGRDNAGFVKYSSEIDDSGEEYYPTTYNVGGRSNIFYGVDSDEDSGEYVRRFRSIDHDFYKSPESFEDDHVYFQYNAGNNFASEKANVKHPAVPAYRSPTNNQGFKEPSFPSKFEQTHSTDYQQQKFDQITPQFGTPTQEAHQDIQPFRTAETVKAPADTQYTVFYKTSLESLEDIAPFRTNTADFHSPAVASFKTAAQSTGSFHERTTGHANPAPFTVFREPESFEVPFGYRTNHHQAPNFRSTASGYPSYTIIDSPETVSAEDIFFAHGHRSNSDFVGTPTFKDTRAKSGASNARYSLLYDSPESAEDITYIHGARSNPDVAGIPSFKDTSGHVSPSNARYSVVYGSPETVSAEDILYVPGAGSNPDNFGAPSFRESSGAFVRKIDRDSFEDTDFHSFVGTFPAEARVTNFQDLFKNTGSVIRTGQSSPVLSFRSAHHVPNHFQNSMQNSMQNSVQQNSFEVLQTLVHPGPQETQHAKPYQSFRSATNAGFEPATYTIIQDNDSVEDPY